MKNYITITAFILAMTLVFTEGSIGTFLLMIPFGVVLMESLTRKSKIQQTK